MSHETKCTDRSRDSCHKVIGSVFVGKSVALFLVHKRKACTLYTSLFIFSFFNIKKFTFSLCVLLVLSRFIFLVSSFSQRHLFIARGKQYFTVTIIPGKATT